jgi:hypothetical protein
MIRRMMLTVCAAVLAWPALAGAHEPVTGMVMRVDEPAGVVVLQDGRMYRIGGERTVIVNDRPVAISTVLPGTRIVIRDAEPVAFAGDRYIAMSPARRGQVTTVTSSTAPATVTTVTTSPASPLEAEPVVTGTVTSYDPATGLVVLSDGRAFQVGPNTVVLVNGYPVMLTSIRPGTRVTLSQVNPIVSRDGRIALMNTGFRDDNGSLLAPDAKYAGYEAERPDAAMQVQSGG